MLKAVLQKAFLDPRRSDLTGLFFSFFGGLFVRHWLGSWFDIDWGAGLTLIGGLV